MRKLPQIEFDRRSLLTMAGIGIAAPILASCGTKKPGQSQAGNTAVSRPKTTEGTIANDGVLTIGGAVGTANVFPENFNVFGGGDSAPGVGLFWETLFRVSASDGQKLVPNLAEKVEYSNGGKVAKYTLRKGVTWSDGQPFTSKDVAFTYGFVFGDPGTKPDDKGNMPWLAKPIETPDDSTVLLTYNNPNYTEDVPLSLYYPIYPEHIYRDLDRQNYGDKNPIGTGPGKLKSFAGQLIVIDIREDYWGEKIEGLKQVKIVPTGTTGNIESQITKGEIDWGQGGAPGGLFKTRFVGYC